MLYSNWSPVPLTPPPINLPDDQILSSAWDAQTASLWAQLNLGVNGHPGLTALTVKAIHVLGVAYQHARAVDILQTSQASKETIWLPAFGAFASSVELLGRAFNGNAHKRDSTHLKRGFELVLNADASGLIARTATPDDKLRKTLGTREYSVKTLAQIRHFAAHGQANANETGRVPSTVDRALLPAVKPMFAAALERYWAALNTDLDARKALAEAKIEPIRAGAIGDLLKVLQGTPSSGPRSLTQLFDSLRW